MVQYAVSWLGLHQLLQEVITATHKSVFYFSAFLSLITSSKLLLADTLQTHALSQDSILLVLFIELRRQLSVGLFQ